MVLGIQTVSFFKQKFNFICAGSSLLHRFSLAVASKLLIVVTSLVEHAL